MQKDNNILIGELLVMTENAAQAAKKFREMSADQLNFRTAPARWSILECFEHLNRYGDFYLPEIEKAILAHKKNDTPTVFRSGILGNYFANLMKVKNGKMMKMKTPSDKNPLGSDLTVTTLDRFLKQLEMLRSLLNGARGLDLTGTKVPISLTKFVKLRLGDTFRFFVNHIERHVLQAERVSDRTAQT